MSKNEKERALTKAELERKEKFEALSERLKQEGYQKDELTATILEANVVGVLLTLPFAAIMFVIYFYQNQFTLSALNHINLLIAILMILALTVVHELIHGLFFGMFAENKFKSIKFGVIWKQLTPYCTCSSPLKRWQYIIGAIMPTVFCGFALGVTSIFLDNLILFCVSELMIIVGAGDFLIIFKLLTYRAKGKQTIYIDHPYKCGLAVFYK